MMGLSISLKKKLGNFSLDVSWEVGNEFAVLFGYSGAGKSLTFQMIAGLMGPDEGVIRLNDSLLFDKAAGINLSPQKRALGYVFQDLALFPHMTVKENILYGCHGIGKFGKEQLANDMIERFRLGGLEEKLPCQISGGQKQRVALARTLMKKPQALLLDEPFSALDNPIRVEMRALLKRIQQEFLMPVVLITHDLAEAGDLADRMIVCSEGKIVQSGTFKDVINYPVSPGIGALVSSHAFFRSQFPPLSMPCR
jgi:molybdate transport system ATP-binding protein